MIPEIFYRQGSIITIPYHLYLNQGINTLKFEQIQIWLSLFAEQSRLEEIMH